MKKQFLQLAFAMLCPMLSWASYNPSDIRFWVGAGTDTAYLVVDFQQGFSSGESSFIWGYRYDGTKTGQNILEDVAAADPNLVVTIGGGFLNSISFKNLDGRGGSPNFWGTFTGTDTADLVMNAGINEPLTNGTWFACSYTDFNPALNPAWPLPALDPAKLLAAQDIQHWFGSGADSVVLVIDFLENDYRSAVAWGYLFNGTITGADLLVAIDAADEHLSISMGGGFLNDITYYTFTGNAGMPNYWGTWSGTNLSNLSMNSGITEVLSNGQVFACTYTDFSPAIYPYEAMPAIFESDLSDMLVVGAGTDTATFIFSATNFNPKPISTYIKIAFNDSINGEEIINLISATNPCISATMSGGFLNSMMFDNFYFDNQGPYYLGTFSGSSLFDLQLNSGLNAYIKHNEIYAVSFTDFNPEKALGWSLLHFQVCESVEENALSVYPKIYPNPTLDWVYWDEKAQFVALYDLAGKRLEIDTTETSLNLSTLKPGVYVVEYQMDGALFFNKIIKQ